MKRSNDQIKLHNLKGELRFLVRLNPEFENRAIFLIEEIESCQVGKESEMHRVIQNIIHEQHEKIRNGISQITR